MKNILCAQGISKSFLFGKERVQVLKDLDLCVQENELVSIIGSSGCGKSTLLELMAGITLPDKGSIIFQDNEITGKSGLLGYMPQDDLLFPWLNTVDNALLPARIKGHKLKEARIKVLELLPVFGLEKHAKLLPYQLSGGLKQRVALLRTYMSGTGLLLLDEPFAALDALTRLQMQEWLIEIKEKLTLTIVFVTHDIGEAIQLSDRIEVMAGNPDSSMQSFIVEVEHKQSPEKNKSLQEKLIGLLQVKN